MPVHPRTVALFVWKTHGTKATPQLYLETRETGRNDCGVARVLGHLSKTHRVLGLHKEGIQQAREALEVYRPLGTTVEQAKWFNNLALIVAQA